MKNFVVSADDRFKLSSTSKGNQIKWVKDGLYLKADSMGYEGFAEALTSELLHYIISDYDFIDYYLCTITEVGTDYEVTYSGCYSKNYLSQGESFISVYSLLKKVDIDIDKTLKKLDGIELVNFIIDSIYKISSIDYSEFLSFMTKFDAITLNEDRHLNNINLVYNVITKQFKVAPIFDNGLSLLSDLNDYPLSVQTSKCINKVKCKPFSTSFKKQVSYFDSEPLKIDYDGFIESIKDNDSLFNCAEYNRARSVLFRRLKAEEGILWERV